MHGDLIEWTNEWNKCINLRSIIIRESSAEYVEVIFSTLKDKLKVLRLCTDDEAGEEDMKKLMDVCARGTKSVEKII